MFVKCPIWHPNIGITDGRVCMSILYENQLNDFDESYKNQSIWSPLITIESIIISFLNILQDPIPPFYNVRAGNERELQRGSYDKKVKLCVSNSIECINPKFDSPLRVPDLY